jgi:3'(2'), 5'-bisphosphate nucleotidase
MNYDGLIAALTPAVDAAGSLILDIKAKGPTSITKSDGSPVTIADQKAENILLAALADLCPDIPVVSEENPNSHHPFVGQRFFLVDPLDGTKEFIKTDDNGAFTVNIGLIENGLPVMGMLYAPARNALYWGHKGVGAFCRKANRIMPITVRNVPDSGAVAVASASHLDAATTNWLADHQINQTTSIGSSLKFALVASGQADVYPRFGPTMEWDTAAGDAILRAAGGMVLHPDGEIYRYGKQDYRNTPFIAYGQLTTSNKA